MERRSIRKNSPYDYKTMWFVINKTVRFRQMLDLANITVQKRRFKCPFHDGKSDSAALFEDDKEGDRLYCFSEEKSFVPTDVIKHGLVDFTIEELFDYVWKQLPEDRKKELLQDSKKEYDGYTNALFSSYKKFLEGFRRNKYDYENFLERLNALNKFKSGKPLNES